jgi:hypothetical protein
MLCKRHEETGNYGVSCFHHLRAIGPPLNPMECGNFQAFFGAAMVAVPKAIQAIRVCAAFGYKAGIDHQSLFMGLGDHWSDRGFVKRDKVKASGIPPRKRFFMIGTVAAQIAKGCMSRKHQQESQEMGEEFLLRFLGVLETNEYALKQSHGVSPFSVAMANTTLEGESACGYLLSKTVRSIDRKNSPITVEKTNSYSPHYPWSMTLVYFPSCDA